jgi:hypothetical protein
VEYESVSQSDNRCKPDDDKIALSEKKRGKKRGGKKKSRVEERLFG